MTPYDPNGISNHQLLDCLLQQFVKADDKENIVVYITGPLSG